MKKILTLLVFGLTLGVSAIAQPTINFSTESPCNGQNFCMDVTVEDFTDIKSLKFTIQFDPTVLQNPTVTSFGLPGMTLGNDFIIDAANGFIHVDWQHAACNTVTPGIDLPDGSLIFQLCFTAVGVYAQTAEVCIAGLPVPEVYREGTGCNNIGLLSTCGLVSVCVRPVELLISDATGQPGDLVCVDFKVTGFDALRSLQFTINWNPDVLHWENCVVGNVPNLSCSSSFGAPPDLPEGTATFTWNYSLPDQPGITLQDSFLFFQICYRVVGECEESTLIEISDAPTMIEVTNDIEIGTNITFLPRVGTFTVSECDPTGLQLSADCGDPVNLNDPVCVKVIAGSNFTNISDFAYLMRWNPSILEFTGVQNLNLLIGNFTVANDFNVSQVDNGILGVNWESTPFPNETLPAGTVMYEVCFNVIGLGGNSPFTFSPPANVQVGNGPNIGINPSNCEVQVIQPSGVVMELGDAEAIPGAQACVPFTVSGFDDITNYQFSMAWDPTHMEFDEVTNINFPDASLANFFDAGASAGLLFFDWDSSTGNGVSIPDGTVIFEVCYTMLSQPNVCDDLALVDLPLIAEAISTTSNGENIGITSNPAEVCTLFPEGYGLIIDETEGGRLDTACVAVSVTSFDGITETNFELNWDPGSLQFTSVELANTWPGLTLAGNFDLSGTGLGAITVDWAQAAGANIGAPNDTTVVFEVCFALIGTPGECFPVEISDTPAPVVETLNGPGSLLGTDGEMCIKDRLIIESVSITPASCASTCDGAITLVVSGGQGPIGTRWDQGPNSYFVPLMVDDLCATTAVGDTVYVTIFDQGNPALILDTFFIIPLAPNQPEANAGEDRVSGCNPPGVLVTGTGSTGPGYTYTWQNISNNGPIQDNNPAILSVGLNEFTVTSPSGCVVRDTMEVLPAQVPVAEAGEGQGFNCLSEIAVLDGSASTATGVTYLWTSNDGGIIAPGEETLSVASALAPGTYVLTVQYPNSNCIARDSVVIADERVRPNANGGAEQRELGCSGDAITLDGSASDNPGITVSYQWLDPNGVALAPGAEVDVDELGAYTLIVTNDDNGCRDTALVHVIPSLEYPQVTFTGDSTLTCTVESVVFTATIAPDTVIYDFSWTALSGGPLAAGETTLSPEANVPGVYQISVTNPENNCTTLDTFIVIENKIPPIANAGEDVALSCETLTHTLDATGSTLGDSITVTWTAPDGTVIPPDELEVSTPGDYILEILNNNNGCSARDTMTITPGQQPPTVTIAEPGVLTCTTTFTALTAMVTPAGTYTYAWGVVVAGEGNIIGATDAATTQVDEAGIYEVSVTDPASGCVVTEQVVVIANKQEPIANAGGEPEAPVITCTEPIATLGGDGTSVGTEFTYEWTTIAGTGAVLPSPNNVFPAEATAAGSYILTVRNTINGCLSRDTVAVTADTTRPVIPALTAGQLTCLVESVTLDASGTTPNTGITIVWTGTNGAPTPADELITEATEDGVYTLTVTNDGNGCESSAEIEVKKDTEPPVISFVTPPLFSCATPSVTLDASASGPVADFSSINWSTDGGGTITPSSGSLTVTVNAPGDYELTLVSADNGCEATGTVTVSPSNDTPVADAGDDFTIGCGETTVLDGSGSTAGNYQWTNISGGAAPAPATDQNPSINAPGTYMLVVTNPVNNCTDRDTVVVTLNNTLEQANAGPDQDLCADETTLTANLPAGATGLWTSFSSAVIATPDQASTAVTNLRNGETIFVWTLSADGCANYSADTVIVVSSGQPVANNDVLNIGASIRTGSVDVSANDALDGINNFEVTLLGVPTFGTIDSFVNNTLHFSVGAGAEGSLELQYQICNLDCAGQCDTATIVINVEDDGKEPELPNTITPNGDGMNEALVFDILLSNPATDFPNNELVVFNRWGDIVYQAKPYLNDWHGTNDEGKDLPHGTYYYILRLNIGNREIIRGDVTIVK